MEVPCSSAPLSTTCRPLHNLPIFNPTRHSCTRYKGNRSRSKRRRALAPSRAMEKLFYFFQDPIPLLSIQKLLGLVVAVLRNGYLQSIPFLHTYVGFCTCLTSFHDEQSSERVNSGSSAAGEPRRAAESSCGCDRLRGEEMEMVMRSIGLRGGEPPTEAVEREKLLNLFADEEPSLGEVKEAFSVFDENGDGFIDELELWSVLDKLGIAEGSDLGACRRMLAAHDRTREGKIDFFDFVKLVEISLD